MVARKYEALAAMVARWSVHSACDGDAGSCNLSVELIGLNVFMQRGSGRMETAIHCRFRRSAGQQRRCTGRRGASALAGDLGAALGAMAANLNIERKICRSTGG